MRLLNLFLAGLALVSAGPAMAYQVQITQPNVPIKAQPNLRSGNTVPRVAPQRLLLLTSQYGSDGELWCQVRLGTGQTGWLQARFLDPLVKANFPLRLPDVPAPLFFDFAQRDLNFRTQANDPTLRKRLRSNSLLMEMAMAKERWEALRQRLNFLELSRRMGVRIAASEVQSLQQEIKTLEQRFQQALSDWQRL